MAKNIVFCALICCLSTFTLAVPETEAPPVPEGYSSDAAVMAAILVGRLKLIDYKNITVPDNVEEILDIEYGTGGQRKLQLDLYLPKGRTKVGPAIIFIHGGAWKMGKRGDMKFYCLKFAEKGYVTATVTYRLLDEAPFPAAVQDVKCAIRWLRANAAQYKVDPKRIAVSGNSAGGHLSMMAGYSDEPSLEGSGGNNGVSSRFCAVVNFYGPTDLTTDYAKKQQDAQNFLGGKTFEEAPDAYKLASPLYHLTKDDPPTLIFQGTIDSLVPVAQADMLADKLKELGIDYVYERYDGWPHTMDLAESVNRRCVYQMEQFFNKHLSGKIEKPSAGHSVERTFRMGLTPFPHDMTLDGVIAAKRFVSENADIISIHIEGVPWLEAHTDKDINPKLLEDWQRHRDAKPPGGKVYLSLSPLNNGRSGIAGYRAERENLPLPEPFVGKALDDPVVIKAYLEYCRKAIRYFEPDYLTIGIEVNELFHNNRSEWEAYTRLHREVYEALKSENSDLPICASFTLHNMLNPDWKDRAEMLDEIKKLMSHNDLVAVSFYPFMAMLGSRMDDCLSWLSKEFDEFKKPYVFSETGQPAEPVVLELLGFTIPASPESQYRVLEKLLSFAGRHRLEFLIWYLPRDYDGLWEKIRADAPEFFGVWRDCGLLDGQGKERPAYGLWQTWFKLPLCQE